MKLSIKLLPVLMLAILASCAVHRTALDVEDNDNLELVNELEHDEIINEVFTTEDKSKTFAISKKYDDKSPAITSLSETEEANLSLGKHFFVITEVTNNGFENEYSIACLTKEKYFYNFVKDDKLYLFTYIDNHSTSLPYSVFLRIWDIQSQKVTTEKVLLRKYLSNQMKYKYDTYINSFEPSVKTSPNKEYFVLYMNHSYGRLMSVYTIEIFDKNAERIKSNILQRKGTVDFAIDDNSDLWLTNIYYDNYDFYYNVEHEQGDLYQSDSYKIRKIKHSEKTNKKMLEKLATVSSWENKNRYNENFYPTNQKKFELGNKVMFFNYIYSSHGNGGVIVTQFDKVEGKIDYTKLIPFHEIYDAVKKQDNEYSIDFIPDMKITNMIEHNGEFYLVMERLFSNLISIEGQLILSAASRDKFFVALDKNHDLKWANAQFAAHLYHMTWDNYSDEYQLQGGSQFEIIDEKLSGIVPLTLDKEGSWSNEVGYFRLNMDLETGKITDQKMLVEISGNCKIYYNKFYPVGENKLIIDQYNRDELYLIKEK